MMRRIVTISLGLLLSTLLGACGAAVTPDGLTTGGSTAPTGAAAVSAPTTAATTAAVSAPTTAATTAADTSTTTAPTSGAAMGATGEATSGSSTSATMAPTGEAAMGATGEATSGSSTSATMAPTGEAAMGATGEAASGTTTAATSGTGTSATTAATSGTGTTEGDLLEAAAANADLATLVTAIQAAGLEETLQGAGPFTIFAPTNEAFAALPAGVLESLIANPEILATILTYHVVEGSVMASDLAAGESVTTVEGQTITVSATGTELQLNNQAKFITTDIETDNGVIHVIDTVLLPPGVALP